MYDKGKSSSGGERSFLEKIEDSYYGFCDSLESKGVKIYEWFVNPLEDRGIPSFPAMIAIVLILLIVLASVFLHPLAGGAEQGAYSLSVTVSTEKGPVDDAKVSLYASKDSTLVSVLKTKNGVALFEGLQGGEFEVRIEKEGFENVSKRILVPDLNYVEVTLKSAGSFKPPAGSGNTKKPPSDLDFSSGSKSLTLNIFVNDANGIPLDASATVYDKTSGTKLGTVNINDGFGLLQNLQAGQVVYADVASDGFAPYYGKTNTVAISARSPNTLTITLERLSEQQLADFNSTFISVTDLNDTAVPGAVIQVFKQGSNTPIPLTNYVTNATGQLTVLLNSSGSPNYKILATKSGFDEAESDFFTAGASVSVRMRHPGEYTEQERQASTNLTITVTSGGAPMPGAAVAVFGDTMLTRNAISDAHGNVNFFLLNQRRNTVQMNASKGILVGSGSLMLQDMVMQAELQLDRQKAMVFVRAIDYFTNESIPSVSFEAKNSTDAVDSCQDDGNGDGCVLSLPMGLTFAINASAPGYVWDLESVPINAQQLGVTFRLVNESLVSDSMITGFKVYSSDTDQETSVLYPGKNYYAAFTLIANTSSSADKAGFYFGVDDLKAFITSGVPPAQFMKYSPSSACTPNDVSDWRNFNAGWIDYAYDGSQGIIAKSVTINFTIKNLNVQEVPFALRYRSYLLKGGQYYRNPFDSRLGFNPDNGALASGCNATVYQKQVVINGVGTTCNDFSCIRVYFTQGGSDSAKDNFTSFVNTTDPSSTPPLLMAYEITLKPDARTLQDPLMLSFNAPGQYLGLQGISYPGEPDYQGTPPNPPDVDISFTDNRNIHLLSIDHIKQYSNIGPNFVFQGVYTIAPLTPVSAGELFLKLFAGAASTEHRALYNVENAGAFNNGGGGNGSGGNGSHGGCQGVCLIPPSPDDCGGSPSVIYNPSQHDQVLLQPAENTSVQCGTIQMRVTSVFPADAIPVRVDSAAQLVATVIEDDGSRVCYESCETDANGRIDENTCTNDLSALTRNGLNILRYNPEGHPSSCVNLLPYGNDVPSVHLKVKLAPTGSGSTPVYVNLSVAADERAKTYTPSLFIGPIYSGVEGGESASLVYPQLWALTNVKQIGDRNFELYFANPDAPNQPIDLIPGGVQFSGPGTKVFPVNPRFGEALVVKEKGRIIFVQGRPELSSVSQMNPYSRVYSKLQFDGPLQASAALVMSNTGFDPEVVKFLLDQANRTAANTVYWRTEGAAVCKTTGECGGCLAVSQGRDGVCSYDQCCRPTEEDWLDGNVSLQQTTEPCTFPDSSPAKFCNNLGNKTSSGNWDPVLEICREPIDYVNDNVPRCSEQFNPDTQVYCDARCVPQATETGYEMMAGLNYGETYKDSLQAQPVACDDKSMIHPPDQFHSGVWINVSDMSDCTASGVCPVLNTTTTLGFYGAVPQPLCVNTMKLDANGRLDLANSDIGEQDWSVAQSAVWHWDQGQNYRYWYCPSGFAFAVSESCVVRSCNTYCSTYGVQDFAPRCDETGLCTPDGTMLKQVLDYNGTSQQDLVNVSLYKFGGDTPALSPFSLFPSIAQSKFTYSIPVNTQVVPGGNLTASQALASVGLPLPAACAGGKFDYQGLFDLQSKLGFNVNGFFWNHALNVFSIPSNAYYAVPCTTPVSQATVTCQQLFIDQRGQNDACIKSITQYQYYNQAPPISEGEVGIPLSQMSFMGRTGVFSGTKQFAISPTGYVIALRSGSSTKQLFDWWRPDGSYGGYVVFTWSRCTFFCQLWKFVLSIAKIALIAAIIYFAFINPAAFGPFLQHLLGPLYWAHTGVFITGVSSLAHILTTYKVVIALLALHSLYGQGLSIYSPDFNNQGCKTAGIDQGWDESQTQVRLLGCKNKDWKLASTIPIG